MLVEAAGLLMIAGAASGDQLSGAISADPGDKLGDSSSASRCDSLGSCLGVRDGRQSSLPAVIGLVDLSYSRSWSVAGFVQESWQTVKVAVKVLAAGPSHRLSRSWV